MTPNRKADAPTSVRVIGLDCATDPNEVGLAWGDYSTVASSRGTLEVLGVRKGSSSAKEAGWAKIVDAITQLASGSAPVLLALDAPLGWPISLSAALIGHSAGSLPSASADCMFQRQTDRLIRKRLDKKPLEVGANLIARTAHSALRRLDQIRESLGSAAPLAWNPAQITGTQIIEVYPAATLVTHGLTDTGYKGTKPEHRNERVALTTKLAKNEHLRGIAGDVRLQMEKTDHALDAMVCCLAAADFLRGEAMPPEPEQVPLAKKEGWIWVKPGPTSR